jgi:hypothetical protein
MLEYSELEYCAQEIGGIAQAMHASPAAIGNRASLLAKGVISNAGKLKKSLAKWKECEDELRLNPPGEEGEDVSEEKDESPVDDALSQHEQVKLLRARCEFMESALVDLQSAIDLQLEETKSGWKPPIGHWSQRPKLYKAINADHNGMPAFSDWLERVTGEYFRIKEGADNERIEKKLREWGQESAADLTHKPLMALFDDGGERIESFVATLENPDLDRLKIYHWATEIMFLYNFMVASSMDEQLGILRDSGRVR